MWKKIKIQNFQIHKNLEIDLKPGVNVIAGSSDSGKSSIIRALSSLILNKDFSVDYLTWGIKNEEMKVSLEMDDHSISRFRSAKKNGYSLDNKTYLATRGSVPEEISKLFHIDDVNIGSQYDAFFLLSSSSGEVARRIQEFCDLSLIQKTISKADSLEKEAKLHLKTIEQELNETKEKLESMDWMEEAQKKTISLRKKEKRIEKLKAKISELKHVLELSDSVKFMEKEYAPVLRYKEAFLKLLAIHQNIEEKKKCYILKLKVKQSIDKRAGEIKEEKKKIQILDYLNEFNDLKKYANNLIVNKDHKEKMESFIESWTAMKKDEDKANKNFNECKKEYDKIKSEIKICPTCGQVIE